jgi:hypothetical protein
MRYCPFCHRWNLGRPQLCYYCGHSWYIRLCPRGHENPYDAQFCGVCGSADLTDTAGPRPWWSLLAKGVFLGLLILLALSMSYGIFHSPGRILPFFLCICFLLAGYYLAISILPGPLKKVFQSLNKMINKGIVRIFSWFWERIN